VSVTLPAEVRDELSKSGPLVSDLMRLADCGGRLSGTESEELARQWLLERVTRIPATQVREHIFAYEGWRQHGARLRVAGRAEGDLACHALLRSPDTPASGLVAEVVDVGRGTTEDFDRVKRELKGRIVLVRHEYPFVPGTIHRRVKYTRSRDEGAVGFIIANNLPDAGLVTGSSGLGDPGDIPAVGTEYVSVLALAERTSGRPRVRLDVEAERGPARAANVVIDVPGREPEWVLLTAHYDGHDLAESALDNGTGAASVIRILDVLARRAGGFRRGLRTILFTTEEWRLLGSQIYVDELGEAERRRIAVVVNLDTLAGSPRLSALTSEFPDLDRFVGEVARTGGFELPVVPGLLRNSDHYNFARHGIPAMRLVAGFGETNAQARYLLTAGDTRDKVEPTELRDATRVSAELVWTALHHPGPMPRHKTAEEMRSML
jgi:hypothetical protein